MIEPRWCRARARERVGCAVTFSATVGCARPRLGRQPFDLHLRASPQGGLDRRAAVGDRGAGRLRLDELATRHYTLDQVNDGNIIRGVIVH